jgi:hypothetical protein
MLRRSPNGGSARRGASDLIMLTLGTGVGGGLVIDDHLYRGWAELGHTVVVAGGQPVPGELPRPWASRSTCLRARGRPGGGDAVRAGLGCAGSGGAGAGRRCGAIAALAEIGRLLGAAIGSLVNIFDPDIVIVGGGFGAAAGDLVLEPRESRRVPRRSSRPTRRSGSSRPSSATKRPDRGSARRLRGARRKAVARAARRLRDPDRQPRDVTLRVLDELGRGHGAVRGHAPHEDPPRAPRDRGAAPLLSPAQRGDAPRRSHPAAPGRRADRARLGRRTSGCQRPGGATGRRRDCAGITVTVLPGPSAVETALVASGLAGEQYRSWGTSRGARRSGRLVAGAVRVAASDGRVRIAEAVAGSSGEPRGGRSRSARRGLPRADEAVRGGRL